MLLLLIFVDYVPFGNNPTDRTEQLHLAKVSSPTFAFDDRCENCTVCLQLINWTELYSNSGHAYSTGSAHNAWIDWAQTDLVSLQPVKSWSWRAWPMNARGVTGRRKAGQSIGGRTKSRHVGEEQPTAYWTKVCRYSWHSAGSLGWPFPTLKYKYIIQIKYIHGSNFIEHHSETVMAWNYHNADCSLRKKFGILSFPIDKIGNSAVFLLAASLSESGCMINAHDLLLFFSC